MTRNIVVTKLGNEPNLFGDDLRFGMLGEWECLKLLKILSDDFLNTVCYYGKAIWDRQKASRYFRNYVQYIEGNITDDFKVISSVCKIDEFHIVLGPHGFYNAGKVLPAWESIRETLVTQRLLERVAPQIRLINANPKAKLYFYLSDRRFLLQAADLENWPREIYAQSLEEESYESIKFFTDNYLTKSVTKVTIEPFRFETLWLYEKNHSDYIANIQKEDKPIKLVVPANQVTSNAEIHNSRKYKLDDFLENIPDYTICGKWTHEETIEHLEKHSSEIQYLDGLDQFYYEKLLKDSKYALVLFNTDDGPSCFNNNWLTVKYWECVHNGCLAFVERSKIDLGDERNNFIPEELQVSDSKELRSKIQMCEEHPQYKYRLMQLQNNLVLPEYYSGEYYNNFLKEKRGN